MRWHNRPWHERIGIYSCAVCAVSVFAVAVTVHPVAARHGSRHGSHGVHERHGKREHGYTPPYADIVLDAISGKVLHADKADELRHPASLTKIMTLYLLFERLEAGKLRLDSQLPVSEHASGQAPTKLGLKPGQTIEVEDAIRGLVTKSANDAAVVVAEAIGGTEHDFAELMTARAHALGMNHTVYRNASGLPNDEQVTTARDQALLGHAINDRFPKYYKYFSTPSFTWQGEMLRNHNHLLGRVEGMDGIKTGYTQASGFNLVASVRRNDRHIVSVVLGGSSAGARDARMRSLIEDYIRSASPQKMMVASAAAKDAARKEEQARKEEARKEKEEARREEARREEARRDEARLDALVRSATAEPVPAGTPARSAEAAGPAASGTGDPRPGGTATAPGSGTYAVASAASEPIKPVQVKTLKVKMAPAQIAALAPAAGTLAPPAAARDEQPGKPAERDLIAEAIRATVKEGSQPASPAATAPPAATASAAPPPASTPPAATPPTVHTGWMVQVGALDSEQEARDRLGAVQAKVGHLLKHASPFTELITSGDKTLYRARFEGINKDQAEAICRQLKRHDMACMTIKN
jgi:D-alanyl-D-alanine carboxypeptidase